MPHSVSPFQPQGEAPPRGFPSAATVQCLAEEAAKRFVADLPEDERPDWRPAAVALCAWMGAAQAAPEAPQPPAQQLEQPAAAQQAERQQEQPAAAQQAEQQQEQQPAEAAAAQQAQPAAAQQAEEQQEQQVQQQPELREA